MINDNAPLSANGAKLRWRALSARDFAALGSEDVAYLRPVTVGGEAVYAIHAADGRQLAMVAERDVADALVRQNEMEPVSVH